jgi:predicted ArsR family transcriptional regulator
MSINSYPDYPGAKTTTPETSVLAALQIADRSGHLRDKVLDVLKNRNCTADEVAEKIGESVLSTRPRLSELRAMGKIIPTPYRHKNASGKSAVVWTVSKPGQGELI